jgi:hypothetical protein
MSREQNELVGKFKMAKSDMVSIRTSNELMDENAPLEAQINIQVQFFFIL